MESKIYFYRNFSRCTFINDHLIKICLKQTHEVFTLRVAVILPFTVLASVARLTGSTLVTSVSKALTGRGEPA